MSLRVILVTTLAVSKAVASDNCFWRSDNQIHAMDGWFACNNTQKIDGGAQLCCIPGSQCGQDSICLQNVNYYVGGCTDGSYGDPVCRTSCSEYTPISWASDSVDENQRPASDSETWIQWNPNTMVWECCGDAGCNGSSPSETFSAIARASWSPVKTAPQSSKTSITTTPTVSSITSTTSLSTSANSTLLHDSSASNGRTGLSTGAQAGIGVACGLFGLAAILAISLLMIKRHKKRRGARDQEQEQAYRLPDATGTAAPPMADKYVPMGRPGSLQPHELVPQPKPELSADTTALIELEGQHDGVTK